MIRFISTFILLCILASCANIVPPSGGKKDMKSPKLLKVVPADSQLNARVTRIQLHFNEYVTVNDVIKELKVSPILKQTPEMSVKGRIVNIKIADSLLKLNTSYSVDFGHAIRDLNEGNLYNGKPFIFSTGTWFDSLHLKGVVYNAQFGLRDSSTGVQVLLYEDTSDIMIVSRQKPQYVTSVKQGGEFTFTGLPAKPFRVYAIKETNNSIKYDQNDELIGFLNTVISPHPNDTTLLQINIFNEVDSISNNKGETDIKDAPPSKPSLGSKPSISSTSQEAGQNDELSSKTLTYKTNIDTSNAKKRSQDILQDIKIDFSLAIQSIDTTKIKLSLDTNTQNNIQSYTWQLDSMRKQLTIKPKQWLENKIYQIELKQGWAIDSSNNESKASLFTFRTKSEDDYAKLVVRFTPKYINKHYLIEILKDKQLFKSTIIDNAKIVFTYLPVGNYTIMIVEDLNNDGKWTSGSLKEKRQPEKVIPYLNGSITTKAGWESIIDFEKPQ